MKKTTFILAIFLFWSMYPTQAEERNMLGSLSNEEEIEGLLLSGNSWITFPQYTDRTAWEGIPENIRKEIISQGEASLDFEWGVVKATDFLEFVRSGDRTHHAKSLLCPAEGPPEHGTGRTGRRQGTLH